jgi:hypothetical protein
MILPLSIMTQLDCLVDLSSVGCRIEFHKIISRWHYNLETAHILLSCLVTDYEILTINKIEENFKDAMFILHSSLFRDYMNM